MFRGLAACVHDFQNPINPDRALAAFRGDDDFQLLEIITRAATTPATIPDTSWLGMIVQTVNSQWIDALHPSAFGQLLARAMNFPTHGALINIPERATTPKLNGSFLAEGQPIPVKRFGLSAATPLRTYKLGVLSENYERIA